MSTGMRAVMAAWIVGAGLLLIGIDRALGYGLKYTAGFGLTHLGRIGKARTDVPS